MVAEASWLLHPMFSTYSMSQAFRNTLLSLRDLIVSAGPLAFLAVGLLVLAYWWLNPNPPKP